MKLNKFISAVALTVSSFMALTSISYASSLAPANTNSNPEINVTFDYFDSTDGATFNVDLVNNETLSYSISKGKVTENAINMIEFHITLDTTVFDVSEAYIWDDSGNGTTSGDNSATLNYVFAPTAAASYMYNLSEHLASFCAPLQPGYTEENIPDTAATITSAIIEYTHYAGVAPSAGRTHHTIYGYNVPTKDYVLSVSFTGTASGGGDPAPVIADVDSTTGEVTFDRTNATLPASAVLDGQTVKVFSNEFTGVTANKRFSITHTPSATTKKFGTTIGDYFGISGAGTVDGIVKVAILFPEGMNASDFTIGMYDAE